MLFVAGAISLVVAIAAIQANSLVTTTGTRKGKQPPEKKESPKRKEIGSIHFSSDSLKQKRKPSYFLKIVKLRPDFELIFIDATPGTDGYGKRLYDHITNDDGFRSEGILLVAHHRIDRENNGLLTNALNSYPRWAIVRIVDTSTHESRLAILSAIRTKLMHPENNKFGYDYVVNSASDLTPPDEDLEPMNAYIQDDVIVNIILNIYDSTDQSWYQNNSASALDFFSGPTFPQYAIDTLGYPPEGIEQNGFARGFQMPL